MKPYTLLSGLRNHKRRAYGENEARTRRLHTNRSVRNQLRQVRTFAQEITNRWNLGIVDMAQLEQSEPLSLLRVPDPVWVIISTGADNRTMPLPIIMDVDQ